MPESPNYYDILQVSQQATTAEIKKAFRRLARQYHPDVCPGDGIAAAKFREILQAYDVLSDPEQRRRYDQHRGETPAASPPSTSASAQELFDQGNRRAQSRDYWGAIYAFTQAIQQDPQFIEALVKRSAARYLLGEDRGVLEDCHQILRLSPNHPQGHYYMGRARYRMGYTQSAIEAYHRAATAKPDFAQVFYYRGLAYQDLREYDRAFEDLSRATALFRDQHHSGGAELAEAALNRLRRFQVQNTLKAIWIEIYSLVMNTFKTAFTLMINPAGGIFMAFSRLDPVQGVGVGLMFALFTHGCFVVGTYARWGQHLELGAWKLALVGMVPLLTLMILSAIARGTMGCQGSWRGDLFLSASVLVPAGLLALLNGFTVGLSSMTILLGLMLFGCYTVLILYGGLTQLLRIAEVWAAPLVPLVLLVSGFSVYWAFDLVLR